MGRPEKEEPSYLKEMLLSPTSTYGFLGAVSASAILSIPFGLGIAVLPLLGFAAAESIAALFVPSSPKFREKVDQKKRTEVREVERRRIIGEIETRTGREAGKNWTTYHRMRDRLDSLRKNSKLPPHELERLEDGTVRFLSLWLSRLIIDERRTALENSGLDRKLLEAEEKLGNASTTEERRRLEKAKSDLEKIAQRYSGLDAKATATDAAMLVIADAFEELHQQTMLETSGVDVTQQLAEAVDKIRVEEAIDLEVDSELENLLRERPSRDAEVSKARKANARAQKTGR